MDERTLLEAVVRAGELMLVNGAEVYRVEDTMKHMLRRSSYQTTEAVVLITGIFVTLDDPEKEPLTLVKRIPQRGNNINRIYRVNDVSRRFCTGDMTAEQALAELDEIENEVQYSFTLKNMGYIGIAALFTPMFGGTIYDFFGAALVGVSLAAASCLVRWIRLNDFCANAFCAFMAAAAAMAVQNIMPGRMNAGVMTISAIMSLVPGVAFTTAIRDILSGDYTSGSSRMLEAVVVALAVAVGVGSGILFYQTVKGGIA